MFRHCSVNYWLFPALSHPGSALHPLVPSVNHPWPHSASRVKFYIYYRCPNLSNLYIHDGPLNSHSKSPTSYPLNKPPILLSYSSAHLAFHSSKKVNNFLKLSISKIGDKIIWLKIGNIYKEKKNGGIIFNYYSNFLKNPKRWEFFFFYSMNFAI